MKKSFINKINRKHIQKISVLLLMFCLITGSLLIPGMAEISIVYSDQDIVITEVCPNPANTSLSSDPFEYVEIVNTSGEVIDLSTCRFQYGKDGFNSSSWNENPLFFHSQGSQLQPGEVFVFLVYSSATVTEGLGYASDIEIENTLSRFNSFYGCNIPSSNFGIAACNLSSSADKHNNAVNLSNSDTNAVIRLLGNNNLILAEVNYDSAAYNKMHIRYILHTKKAVITVLLQLAKFLDSVLVLLIMLILSKHIIQIIYILMIMPEQFNYPIHMLLV